MRRAPARRMHCPPERFGPLKTPEDFSSWVRRARYFEVEGELLPRPILKSSFWHDYRKKLQCTFSEACIRRSLSDGLCCNAGTIQTRSMFYNGVGSGLSMKNNKHPDFDSPTYFSGHCAKCGEIYEAQSKTDDLEGITFKCKKALCQGRVTLGVGKQSSLAGKDAQRAPIKPSDGSSGSRRFC